MKPAFARLARAEWRWWILFLLTGVGVWIGYAGGATMWYGLGIAAIPVIPGGLVLWWMNRLPPIAGRYLFRAFAWGMLVVTIIAANAHLFVQVWIEGMIEDSGRLDPGSAESIGSVAGSVLSVPIVEESLKGLLPILLLWSRGRPILGIWPGVFAGSVCAIAFGYMENAVFFARASAEADAPGFFGLLTHDRNLFAYLHALFSLPLNFAIGWASVQATLSQRVATIAVGWGFAVVLHGLWNWEVLLGHSEYSLVPWFGHVGWLSPAILLPTLGLAWWLERNSLRRFGVEVSLLRLPSRENAGAIRAAQLRRLATRLEPTVAERQELASLEDTATAPA